METWFIIVFIISLCLCVLLKSIFAITTTKQKLPPGPIIVPIIGNFLFQRKSLWEIEAILVNLRAKLGSIVTLKIGSRTTIFISDRSIAYEALVQNGAIFSDRPAALLLGNLISSNQRTISSAGYGPTWRLLRRNLTSEILHPSRAKSFAATRNRVSEILIRRLEIKAKSDESVRVGVDFQFAIYCLLVFMCFGDTVNEDQIKDIENVQRKILLGLGRFNFLNFWPSIAKFVFKKHWEELIQIFEAQENVLLPLIRKRKELMNTKQSKIEKNESSVLCYVDTLLNLQLPDEKRKLEEKEIVNLCSEFLNAGVDTTSTALQWIMANIVKHPHVQNKLFEEITEIAGPEDKEVIEEDLQKMPYLKAVILEGLRRHPPLHFLVPHTVTEDVTSNGYLVPKKGSVNFLVSEIGWDLNVWEDPMEFKPERFLSSNNGGNGGHGNNAGEMFDITSSREIKMMPFGAGRRICPGYGLALLHLEYFVANLVKKFEWTAVIGDEVDLAENHEFTVVMKNPLKVHLVPRFNL